MYFVSSKEAEEIEELKTITKSNEILHQGLSCLVSDIKIYDIRPLVQKCKKA